jgi:hypothetical protein
MIEMKVMTDAEEEEKLANGGFVLAELSLTCDVVAAPAGRSRLGYP